MCRLNPNLCTALDDFEKHLPVDGFLKKNTDDAGAHYRYSFKGINLDPFRIAKIYGMTDFCMMTILKKCLCAGNRGHKDFNESQLGV